MRLRDFGGSSRLLLVAGRINKDKLTYKNYKMAQLNNLPKRTNPNIKHDNPKNQKEVSDNIRHAQWERKKRDDKYFG